MKTIEGILDASAKKELFENFEQVRTCVDLGTITANTLTDIVKDAMTKYAIECCEEQKIICYNEAYIINDPDDIGKYEPSQIICKDSIIDCKNFAETN